MVPSARSVPFKTPASVPPYADRMTPQFDLIGSAVSDMARTLDFYRRLGLDIPADADHEDHVEVALPGGLRLAWDTVTMLRGFHPDWTPPSGSPRASLAFRCADPAEVDRYWADADRRGLPRRDRPLGRLLGPAVRHPARPGRQRRRPLRPARPDLTRPRVGRGPTCCRRKCLRGT